MCKVAIAKLLLPKGKNWGVAIKDCYLHEVAQRSIATYFVGVAIKDCYLHNFVVLGKKIAASHNEVVQAATLAIAKLLLPKGYRQRSSKM